MKDVAQGMDKSMTEDNPTTADAKPITRGDLPVVYDAEGNPITSRSDAEGTLIMTRLEHQAVKAAYETNKWKYRSEKYLRKEARKLRLAKFAYTVYPIFEIGIIAGIVLGTDYDAAAHGLGKIGLKHEANEPTLTPFPIELFIGKELKEKQEQKIQAMMNTIAAPFFVDPANLYPPTTQDEKIRKNMAGSLPKNDIIDKAGNKTNLGKVELGKHTYYFNAVIDKTGSTKHAYLEDSFLDNGSTFSKLIEIKKDESGNYTIQGFPINSLDARLRDIPFIDLSTDGASTMPTDELLGMVTQFVTETMTDASVLQPVIRKDDSKK